MIRNGWPTCINTPSLCRYTSELVTQAGRRIMNETALSFPRQCIKLPLGMTSMHLDGSASLQARNAVEFGVRTLGERFVPQMNSLNASGRTRGEVLALDPDEEDYFFLYKLLAQRSPAPMALQDVAGAIDQGDSCRQNGHVSPCDPQQVAVRTVEVAKSFQPLALEIWTDDALHLSFAPVWANATLAFGGKLRH